MSKRSTTLYLEDMRSSIKKIRSYTKGLSFDTFRDNSQVVDAVVRNLEIIGWLKDLVQKLLVYLDPSNHLAQK